MQIFPRSSRAFTIIELLIVVSIIAILAAIAVPNFLEAQTRAKVSRAKSDLRSLATAIEVYRIDRNHYPPDVTDGVPVYVDRLRRLTTPIAYISAVPADPFADKGKIVEYTTQMGSLNPYASPPTLGGNNWVYPLTYDFAQRRSPDGTLESVSVWRFISRTPGSIMWGMRSVGPDRWPAWLGEDVPAYDPTNGTVSTGNIYWTGPGKGEDNPVGG